MEAHGVSLAVEVDRNDDVSVVRCRGAVVSGLADHLDTVIGKLIPHNRLIIIDLAEVTWADQKGVDTLARLVRQGAAGGCKLKLINAEQNLHDVPGLLSLQMWRPREGDPRALPIA